MGTQDDVIDIDNLERRLLTGSSSNLNSHEDKEGDEPILYDAPFEEMEHNYVKYQTALWVLYSLLLILAWGIGLLMLLYLPVRRYVLRKDFQSRRLYVTPNSIVYKVSRPVPFPCLGVLKKEKHVLLPSVAGVTVEQGYLQSLFGIYSIRIENNGVRRAASDDVHIQGVANPRAFRKVVLTRISSMRGKNVIYPSLSMEDRLPTTSPYSPGPWASPSKSRSIHHPPQEEILRKLDEVESTMKRVQMLIEKKPCQTLDLQD